MEANSSSDQQYFGNLSRPINSKISIIQVILLILLLFKALYTVYCNISKRKRKQLKFGGKILNYPTVGIRYEWAMCLNFNEI